VNTECCYQQQGGYDNSYIDSYQNRPIQHYYSSPYAYCLLQSKINSILQSRSILTTFILPTFGRMTALFWAFIYSWALILMATKKDACSWPKLQCTNILRMITSIRMLVNAGSVVRSKWEETLYRESFLPIVSALFRLIFWRPEATRARWREPGRPVRKGRILHTPLDRTDRQSSRCSVLPYQAPGTDKLRRKLRNRHNPLPKRTAWASLLA